MDGHPPPARPPPALPPLQCFACKVMKLTEDMLAPPPPLAADAAGPSPPISSIAMAIATVMGDMLPTPPCDMLPSPPCTMDSGDGFGEPHPAEQGCASQLASALRETMKIMSTSPDTYLTQVGGGLMKWLMAGRLRGGGQTWPEVRVP